MAVSNFGEFSAAKKIGGIHQNRTTDSVCKFSTILSIDLQGPIGTI